MGAGRANRRKKNGGWRITLLVDGELRVQRGQRRVGRTDRHLAGPLTLFFGVHARESERAISTKVAVAREFLSDDFWIVSVKRFPGPRTFLDAAARYAFQRGLRTDRRGSVRRYFNEADFGWNESEINWTIKGTFWRIPPRVSTGARSQPAYPKLLLD